MLNQQNSEQVIEDLINPVNHRLILCNRHKKQKVTHICIQSKCQNNPFLCTQCFSENINRSYHYEHDKNILPISEAIEKIAGIVKAQIDPMKKIFKTTLGRSQYAGILDRIQKSQHSSLLGRKDDLAERISSIKNQLQLEFELLLKEFQKIILIEKQEYYKTLDNYQKAYIKNLEYIKNQSHSLIQYENSVRYFANQNTLHMKIVKQNTKKSDWLIKLKKSIHSASKNLQNSSYNSDLNGLLYLANKAKIDMWPAWKGEENSEKSISIDLKYFIKRAITQWTYVPDTKSLQEQIQNHAPTNISSLGSKRSVAGLTANSPLVKNYYNSGPGK